MCIDTMIAMEAVAEAKRRVDQPGRLPSRPARFLFWPGGVAIAMIPPWRDWRS